MILFKRRYCRKHGHDTDPDPGDLVLFCRRCHLMVDIVQAFENERQWLADTRTIPLPGGGRPMWADEWAGGE